ncbi:hypothetical protein RCS94_10810 [Orbaceae bacterium ac157xtp]
MIKVKYLILSFFCFLLIGCDYQAKSRIESTLSYKDRAICFSNHSSEGVYQIDIINLPKPNNLRYKYQKARKALSLFTRLGFFTEEKLPVDPSSTPPFEAYRYTSVKEMENYIHYSGLCFGNIVVHEVTKTEDIKQFIGHGKTGKRYYFTYSFTDIPEWANSPELAEAFDIKLKFDGRLHEGIAYTNNNEQTLKTNVETTFYLKEDE